MVLAPTRRARTAGDSSSVPTEVADTEVAEAEVAEAEPVTEEQ